MSAKEPFLARLWFSYDTAGPAPHDGIKEPPPHHRPSRARYPGATILDVPLGP
jgi:hypothetical protein